MVGRRSPEVEERRGSGAAAPAMEERRGSGAGGGGEELGERRRQWRR
jgi:hypothetical protein